ncbi:hypothetical protein PN36_19050 [Candidatus Thiomargarita nelsonii]|uniref:Uncharacterized protein n=1 Tax=Candidatus Thiomargarita nelsonii TaxID=1003181 RepID=A0A4E0R2G5_9GAMM|nr:hypothetical protein PN36_19050 [Candidatus Thiomargarita nelsonii]
MSQFLWIEDFEGDVKQSFTRSVFGEFLDNTQIPNDSVELKEFLKDYGILVELTFSDALQFIHNPENIFQVDYIILDVDLAVGDADENGLLSDILNIYGYDPQDEESYKVAEKALKKVAGYQLYIELVMGLDFPKDHILFCSNHINELTSLKDAFQRAKIKLPPTPNGKLALSKEKDDSVMLKQWVRERRNNAYSVLRRGIIEGCQHIQKHLTSANILFGQFCKKENGQPVKEVTVQNMHDYLETLRKFLPRREPLDAKLLYKLFVRTLSHEWEDDFSPNNFKKADIPDESVLKRQKTFGWAIKCARNWIYHAQILDELCEDEVAFLFIVAMRAMFKLSDSTETYENILLNLFTDKLQKQELKTLIEQRPDELLSKCSTSYSELLTTYAQVLETKKKLQPLSPTRLDFSSMLKNMQYEDKNNEAQFDYVTGLFQMFWHDLSPMTVKSFTPTQDHQKIFFEYEYDFELNDYGKEDMDSFLFEFARCIYLRAFQRAKY